MIEDTLSYQDLMRIAFEENNLPHKLHIVSNGESALKFLRREKPYCNVPRPDLILLDLNLPKINGHELLKTIKEEPKFKIIPVIILTSSNAQKDIIKSYNLKANCYLNKPYNLQELINLVKISLNFWLNYSQLPQN
ncbi:response regulator [Hyella patelloides]|uniref:response regulator n=1 Tax=Hyella patelloides TaxID=1982969 RepID=UPI001C971A3D|nr:response regulator [Hyella patelloides]